MSSRLARPLLAALLSSVPVLAQAQPPAPPATPPAAGQAGKEQLYSLKLPDADIDTILTTLESYTGKHILRPSTLPPGNYNVKIENKSKAEIISYLLTVLTLNRIGVAPLGDSALKVVDLTMTRTEAPEMITGSSFDQPPSGKIAVKIFQLDFMRVADFAAMVQPMLNPNMQGGLVQLQGANAAIVTDTVSNLQRIEVFLRELDKPNAGMIPKFYPLASAKASDIVTKLRGIIAGPLQTQLGTATTFSADDRTNQVIVVTDPRLHPFFDELITKLSGKSDPNTRNEVIYLKHAEAPKVATILQQLINGQATAAQKANNSSVRPGTNVTPGMPTPATPTPTPAVPTPAAVNLPGVDSLLGPGSNEFSGLLTIIPDERSNAVVVSGTVEDLRLLSVLIEKLDTILAQVRLEVVIAEVNLTDNNTTGISQLGMTISGDKLTGFSGSFPGVAVADGKVSRPDGTANISGPWDLAATIGISTTPRKDNTSILSVPSITTTHNKDAKFFFGETRPIVSGITSTPTTGGTSGFSTSSQVQQQEIGTTITVKPLIGNDGSVQLDIKMEISEVGPEVKIDNNAQYVIYKRTANSFTIAKSGEIIVLGGMQRKRDTHSTNRLGPIPIIGDIFGSRSKQDQRTDLIFFIRPIVLTNTPQDNVEALNRVEKFDEKQRDLVKQRLDPTFVPEKKPFLRKVER